MPAISNRLNSFTDSVIRRMTSAKSGKSHREINSFFNSNPDTEVAERTIEPSGCVALAREQRCSSPPS